MPTAAIGGFVDRPAASVDGSHYVDFYSQIDRLAPLHIPDISLWLAADRITPQVNSGDLVANWPDLSGMLELARLGRFLAAKYALAVS